MRNMFGVDERLHKRLEEDRQAQAEVVAGRGRRPAVDPRITVGKRVERPRPQQRPAALSGSLGAMLRAGGVRLLLLAILALLACAPAAAACAPDSGPNLSNRVVTSGELTKYSSLECVNFQHADLRGISFLQADLKTADFRYTIVTGDDFSQATLQDSNFYGAQAARANFGQAMMQYANLRDANLQGADFIQTYLQHATLNGSNTSGADFTQADTYDSSGVLSSSGSGSVTVIIFIAIGLLIAVPVLITILKVSKASRK